MLILRAQNGIKEGALTITHSTTPKTMKGFQRNMTVRKYLYPENLSQVSSF